MIKKNGSDKRMIQYIEKIKENQRKKAMKKFISALTDQTNLNMIEIMKGRKLTFMHRKEWKRKLNEEIENLLPIMTYREWIKALQYMKVYQAYSTNKNDNIKANLYHYLQEHYKKLYQSFCMGYYAQYQTEAKEEIKEIIFIYNAVLNESLVNAVYIEYQNERRICYIPETGERTMIELLEMSMITEIVTLVDHTPKNKLFEFFFEVEE